MSSFIFKRVVVIGVTSSGKSTLAERLAKRFCLDYIELDALYWEPGWRSAPLEVFRARVKQAAQAEKWIAAGNYRRVRDLLWPRAEAAIWLDYSLRRVLYQMTRRNFTRALGQARAQYELVHKHGLYDLEVDTSKLSPRECAQKIKEHIQNQREPKALRLIKAREQVE